jgi:hypothetical protein
MEPLIPDSTTDSRMTGLEQFLERYLGARRPEYGVSDNEVRSVEMPAPLQRFFRFAGRWPGPGPGHDPPAPFANRFCIQDWLCGIVAKEYAPALQVMDDRLVFVWENQGCWVAATERAGIDPPVWITEECSHRETRQVWRQLENRLSHFLVSFVLQEVMFGSELVAVAPGALEKFEAAGLSVEPVWIRGEYAWSIDRPSYFLVGERFLLRRAPDEAGGDDWYGCKDAAGADVLTSLGLPSEMRP